MRVGEGGVAMHACVYINNINIYIYTKEWQGHGPETHLLGRGRHADGVEAAGEEAGLDLHDLLVHLACGVVGSWSGVSEWVCLYHRMHTHTLTHICNIKLAKKKNVPTMLSRSSRLSVLQSVSSEGRLMSLSRLHWRAEATIELTMGGPRASDSRRPL